MKVIDLSKEIYAGMEVHRDDPQVKIELVHNYNDYNWQLRKISMGSHTATHVDAFSHMHCDKESLDNISIERFFGKAQVVDIKEKLPINIGLFFIEEIDINSLDKILAAKPGFVGGNITEALERALLNNDVITYTNLINLEQIPKSKSFMFYGLPLKIRAGDGSPVRAIAIIED